MILNESEINFQFNDNSKEFQVDPEIDFLIGEMKKNQPSSSNKK